jgi:hypothetical protein
MEQKKKKKKKSKFGSFLSVDLIFLTSRLAPKIFLYWNMKVPLNEFDLLKSNIPLSLNTLYFFIFFFFVFIFFILIRIVNRE